MKTFQKNTSRRCRRGEYGDLKFSKVSPLPNVIRILTTKLTFQTFYIEALQMRRVRRALRFFLAIFKILKSQPTTKCNTYSDYSVDF